MSKQVSKKSTQSVTESSVESSTKQLKTEKVQEKTKVTEMPEPVTEPVVEAEATEGDDKKDNVMQTFYVELQNEISSIQERLSTLKSNLKKFHKNTSKQIVKMSRNRKNNGQPRSPTGFGKPCFVPSSLRGLLQLKDDDCITRPSVTKKLYEYIETNSLYSETDKRLLRVNDQLSKALQLTVQEVKAINSSSSVSDKQGLNFYNIQKYVARLYPKNVTSEVEVSKNIVVELDTTAKKQSINIKKTK
jgi:chromatin remodeling complex protein RSC6